MGKPMAINLLKAGYSLIAYNTSQQALDELQPYGAMVADSPASLARDCSFIISMLPDSPEVKKVVLGKNGLIEGLRPGSIYIDMSTIDVGTVIEISEKLKQVGTDMLDAPVSGGQVGAESGSLSIMAGGTKASFDRSLPIFRVLGKKISYMGAIGSGQITKSCSQIATALTTQGIIEAFTLAKNAGVDITLVREALLGGFAESRALTLTGEKIIRQDFKPGFKLKLYRKDLRIAQQAAAERSLTLPGTLLVAGEMEKLVQDGKGDLDFSALIDIFEK
jgi:2-hydroxy-3-oxopropionate reductase